MKIQYKYGIMWLLEVSIALLVSFAYSYYITTLINESHKAVQHTQMVINYVDKLRLTILNAETGQRGYIITGNEDYLKPYKTALTTVHANIDQLQEITLEDPVQHSRVIHLNEKIYLKLKELDRVIQIRSEEGFERASKEVSTHIGINLMIDCQNTLDLIFNTEYNALQKRQLNEQASLKIMKYTIPLVVFMNFMMLILVYYLIREQETIEIKKIISAYV